MPVVPSNRPPLDADPSRSAHQATRVFLAVSAVLNVAMVPFVRAQWPDEWDPLAPRAVLTAVCLLALGASYTDRLKRYTGIAGVAAGSAMQAWYLYIGYVNGLSTERGLNTLMLVLVAVVFCHELVQLVAFMAITLAFLILALTSPIPPGLPAFTMITVSIVLGAAVGVTLHYRKQLEAALEGQTQHAQALHLEVERRRHAEQEALQASRAKSAFLAHMSHELRTPLNAILGYGELVEEELAETDAAFLQDDVGKVLVSARHLLGLIDEVLDLARIEAGMVELEAHDVDIPEVVDQCLALVGPAAKERGNRLSDEVPADLTAHADRGRLRQILLNLLSNAIKFTQDGQITVRARRAGPETVIAVSDTGCGIPNEALPTLFDPFVMVDGHRRQAEGTGLGLAICRELAERMGGSLRVTSEVGRGSTFTLTLPHTGQSASQSTTSTV